MTGSIYLIKNNINGKCYIGQTVQSPFTRWREHLNSAARGVKYPLHKALRKLGVVNFSFSIVEDGIPRDSLNDREIYWVNFYNSYEDGYNCNVGGGNTYNGRYFNLNSVQIVKKVIKETTRSLTDIADEFGVPPHTISDINCGETWYDSSENYPLRKTEVRRPHRAKDHVDDIILLIKQGVTFKDISSRYNLSLPTISKINMGLVYRKDCENYPIRILSENPGKLTLEDVKFIVEYLRTHTGSYTKLSKQIPLRCGRKTLAGIDNGTLYKDMLKELNITKFPLKG